MSLSWSFSYGSDSGKVSIKDDIWFFGYPCSSSASCSNIKVTIEAGTYLFELWGAQGGDSLHSSYESSVGPYPGAVGGYTLAAKTFDSKTELELFIGGMGGLGDDISAGFNGGGKGYGSNFYNKGAAGGGATDIRIKSGGSSSKILIAGGGGGSNTFQQSDYNQKATTGVGGGLEGGKGIKCLGGGQNSKSDPSCTPGTLGQGAAGKSPYGSGGGGGYYGGSAGANRGENGGGGSGFIDSSFTKTNGITPTTLDGTKSFPRSTLLDSGNETGHEGNGAVRITKLSPARTFGQTIGRTLFQTFAPTQTRTAIPRHIYELCFAIVRNSERDSCIASGKKKFLVTMCQVMLIGLK